jgi:hypothetical protein
MNTFVFPLIEIFHSSENIDCGLLDWHCVLFYIVTNFSEEPAASICRVEETCALKREAGDLVKMLVTLSETTVS